MQTLVWLLIRYCPREEEIMAALLPYVKKHLLLVYSENEGLDERGGTGESKGGETNPFGMEDTNENKEVVLPEIDLDFLLRECHRQAKRIERNKAISMLNILLGRDEEAIKAALKIDMIYAKEVCKLLCGQGYCENTLIGAKIGNVFTFCRYMYM
jgi:hypothetical protein